MGVDLAIVSVMDPQRAGAVLTRRHAASFNLLRHSIRFFPRRVPGVSHPRRYDTFVLGERRVGRGKSRFVFRVFYMSCTLFAHAT